MNLGPWMTDCRGVGSGSHGAIEPAHPGARIPAMTPVERTPSDIHPGLPYDDALAALIAERRGKWKAIKGA